MVIPQPLCSIQMRGLVFGSNSLRSPKKLQTMDFFPELMLKEADIQNKAKIVEKQMTRV